MEMFDKLRHAVKQRKEDAQTHLEEESKERLFRIVKKKLETTFIGDIAAIENAFGDLWGDQFNENQLTEEEKLMRKTWATLRINILDRGNAQIRGIKSELEQHTVTWDGYNYQFVPKERDSNERH